MSQYAIIFQVLAGALVLFFIFLTYMNTKTWRWVHVTFTFLVFAASLVFCFYAAQTLKTRAAWIGYHDKKEQQVAELTEQLERVSRGDPPSLMSVREQLARTVLDRGRVWRQVTPTIGAAGVVISTAPPALEEEDPNAPPPPPAENLNLQAKDILYAFGEARGEDGNVIGLLGYIGEFQVTEATDTSATLANTLPLTPQQREIATRSATWTLYEVMPVDGHRWFEDLEEVLADTEPPPDRQLFQQVFNSLPEPAKQSYLRDGKPAEDNDPPENVWVELSFLQPYRVPVDAPAVESIDSDTFNPEGQAQVQRLRRAAAGEPPEEVEFGPGPTQINRGIFDLQTATSLVDQGIAQVERRIYRRRLTDYERKFHSVHQRIVEINSRMRDLNEKQQAIVAATEKANSQAALLTDLQNKLNEDLEKAEFELNELAKYGDALAAKLSETQAALSTLYRSNQAIGRELAETSARLTEDIDNRTRQATALNR
jgi:hypothetical protein